MATKFPKQEFQIFIHGNNDFKYSKLLEKLSISHQNSFENQDFRMKFFVFSDLDLFHPFTHIEPPKDHELNVEDASAILVLVSQTEIFSDGMRQLICDLPYNPFYGLSKKNEKTWWKGVIVVFSFGENEGGDKLVKQSISGNRGVREIVDKAGGRYIWMSDNTKCEDFAADLQAKVTNLSKGIFVGYSDQRYQELKQSFEKYFPGSSVMCTRKNLDHRFILIGEIKSGKSTLRNLLMGPRDTPLLEAGWYYKPSGKEKSSLVGDTEIEIGQIYSNKCKGDSALKIQIVDGPDSLSSIQYGEFLANCIPELRRTTFLILINLISGSLSHQGFNKIKYISKIFSSHKLDLFSKSMIVFTHVDELNNEDPETFLREFSSTGSYLYVHNLISLVNQRYIWINGTKIGSKNRYEVLRKLFQAFPSETHNDKSKNDSKEKTVDDGQLNEDASESRITTQKRNSTKSPIITNYEDMADILQKLFNCDQVRKIELHQLFSLNDSEIEMREVFKILWRNGSSKVILIMINFEEKRTQEIDKKLFYIFNNEDFWMYALVAFKVQFGREYCIREEIPERFEVLVKKNDSRYIYLIEKKLNNGTEKDKSLLNQKREKLTHLDVNEGEKNDNSVCKEKLDHKETSECQHLDSKVFLSHNAVFSSNETHEFLFSYFILDEIEGVNHDGCIIKTKIT